MRSLLYFAVLPLSLVFLTVSPTPAEASSNDVVRAFSTGGHTIYHLRCASMASREKGVLIGAATDGMVLCFSKQGAILWRTQVNRALPLDLNVADLDNDGQDETLVASADGSLSVLDSQGILKWRFSREAPLLQVCVLKASDGRSIVLTGGIDKKLYALSAGGRLLKSLDTTYVVRHIRSGHFTADGATQAVVITAKNDKSRFFVQLYEPAPLKPIWDQPVGLATNNPTAGTQFDVPWLAYRVPVYSVLSLDINRDKHDEILMTDGFGKKGVFYAYDFRGKKLLTASSKGLRGRPYRMNLLTHIPATDTHSARVVGLFGNQIILYRLDGSIERIADGPYSLACVTFDNESRTLFLGSSISGGDGIYGLKIDRSDWSTAFETLKPVGRMAEVEDNMRALARQVQQFQPPAYQPKPRPTTVITGTSSDELRELYLSHFDYRNVEFVQFNLFTEDFDRTTLASPWDKTRESRHPYNFTADQIVAFAAEREARHEPFALWAGHGNDPFYMQLETIQRLLKAAPTAARALIYPEMERTDAAMQYAVRHHIVPVIEACRKQGVAKVILRNKNIFWNASCYLDFWKSVALDRSNEDVIVPSMEETNGRTQAISLSGRVGLWLCGFFDHISTRVVTDNANFSRFWEWSSQQRLSHLFRALTLGASLGSDMFLVNIYQGDPRELATFYQMVDRGIIAIPNRRDLLSVADVCLGMRTPSPRFLQHGKNGHGIDDYEPNQPPAVFSRLDCYWGGAPTESTDFSRYAMGSDNRMLNFLPTNPYGFIASVPADTLLESTPHFRSMIESDGEFFFDASGTRVTATDYQPHVLDALSQAAARLPIRVLGQVAWTVARLDSHHIRITLIDPGYLSPAARQAEIALQHVHATKCRDILTGEELPIDAGTVRTVVPAGVVRIVDIEHN